MPNKLSDSEIKKAIEKCVIHKKCKNCMLEDESGCSRRLLYIAYNLINRLQAENERLEKEIENLESMQEISPEAKHFVDTKADKVISLLNEVIKSQEQIKAEAYKEFATKTTDKVEKARQKYERLCKEQGEEMEEHMHIHFNGIIKIIDDLLKELVGDK